MAGFVNAMTNGTTPINASAVSDNLTTLLPVIAVFFGVGLTMYVVRKLLRGGAKLKFKI